MITVILTCHKCFFQNCPNLERERRQAGKLHWWSACTRSKVMTALPPFTLTQPGSFTPNRSQRYLGRFILQNQNDDVQSDIRAVNYGSLFLSRPKEIKKVTVTFYLTILRKINSELQDLKSELGDITLELCNICSQLREKRLNYKIKCHNHLFFFLSHDRNNIP